MNKFPISRSTGVSNSHYLLFTDPGLKEKCRILLKLILALGICGHLCPKLLSAVCRQPVTSRNDSVLVIIAAAMSWLYIYMVEGRCSSYQVTLSLGIAL